MSSVGGYVLLSMYRLTISDLGSGVGVELTYVKEIKVINQVKHIIGVVNCCFEE